MTPFWAFIIGAFLSGIVLSLVFGAFHLEAEERAYQRGYADGLWKGRSNESNP
jgi:hypothetical protein